MQFAGRLHPFDPLGTVDVDHRHIWQVHRVEERSMFGVHQQYLHIGLPDVT
ncbi:Uncharacterised protein [Mycobacteroides abscessus]|nr:Uncharacterised protein [Mycobacteroides abscessus]